MEKTFKEFVCEATMSAEQKEDLKFAKQQLKDSIATKMLKSPNNGILGKDGGFIAFANKSDSGYPSIFVRKVFKQGTKWLIKNIFYDIRISEYDKRIEFSTFSQDTTSLGGSKVPLSKIFELANQHIQGSSKGKSTTFKKFDEKISTKM